MFGSMLGYSMPAKLFRIASKIIFAPLHGTAMPICFLTLSLLPINLYVSGNVCRRARSRFVRALDSFQW